MPKKHQQRPAKAMHGRNKAEHSTVITTGTYKKKQTYQEQARLHQNPHPLPQRAKVPPQWITPPEMNTTKANSLLMMERGERRSGTDSNAHKARKTSRMHEPAERQPEPLPSRVDDFDADLRPDNFAGANYGMLSKQHDAGLRASDIKELHGKLADLTRDELREIVIVPLGEYLEQGATYIDLNELEKGEFTALAERVSDEDHYYVPKKQTGYVLWNRLNQIENPARLDEAGPAAP